MFLLGLIEITGTHRYLTVGHCSLCTSRHINLLHIKWLLIRLKIRWACRLSLMQHCAITHSDPPGPVCPHSDPPGPGCPHSDPPGPRSTLSDPPGPRSTHSDPTRLGSPRRGPAGLLSGGGWLGARRYSVPPHRPFCSTTAFLQSNSTCVLHITVGLSITHPARHGAQPKNRSHDGLWMIRYRSEDGGRQ